MILQLTYPIDNLLRSGAKLLQ